jgi:hypothetical protein
MNTRQLWGISLDRAIHVFCMSITRIFIALACFESIHLQLFIEQEKFHQKN